MNEFLQLDHSGVIQIDQIQAVIDCGTPGYHIVMKNGTLIPVDTNLFWTIKCAFDRYIEGQSTTHRFV